MYQLPFENHYWLKSYHISKELNSVKKKVKNSTSETV